jgi:acyl carrier protein
LATRDEIIDVLRAAMDEVAEVDAAQVTEASELAELGVDSLDLIEIVMIVEEKLGIDTKSEDFEGVATVGNAVDAISRRADGG